MEALDNKNNKIVWIKVLTENKRTAFKIQTKNQMTKNSRAIWRKISSENRQTPFITQKINKKIQKTNP